MHLLTVRRSLAQAFSHLSKRLHCLILSFDCLFLYSYVLILFYPVRFLLEQVIIRGRISSLTISILVLLDKLLYIEKHPALIARYVLAKTRWWP